MSWCNGTLQMFSALIFLFAVYESTHRLEHLAKRFRAEFRHGGFDARKGLHFIALMAISIGPAGYYGMHFLRELGLA